MRPEPLLCLCQQYDLKALYSDGFAAYPGFRLVTPDEVEDPAAIRYVLAFRPRTDAFDDLPNVQLVCSIGAGVDGLLTHPGLRPEMRVVRMVNPEQAQMMAGFAAWYVVGHHRGMWDFPRFQADRTWAAGHRNDVPSTFPVAVLGYGAMGRATGRALAAMGYPVTGWAASPKSLDGIEILAGRAALEELLGRAKAVVCLLPLTAETEGMLDAELFAKMRDDAILIQLGRGGHLVESELIQALDAGRPALAALDVFAGEPLPLESPLWAHPKVMITPHVASDSDGAAIARSVVAAISAHQRGEAPAGLVDRQKGY